MTAVAGVEVPRIARLRGTAGATVVVSAFWLVGVIAGATRPLADPDVWWHIRAGNEVLRRGDVPRVDEWSIAGAGNPWTSQDWLSNVVLATGHALGPWGWTLLSVGFALATAGAFWILWSAIGRRRPETGWVARVLSLTAGFVLAGPVVGVRAQLADLVLAAAVMWVLWRFMTGARLRLLALLPVIGALWVNLHAGWLLLFLLGGAVLVGETADRLVHRRLDCPPQRPGRLAWLGGSLLASAAALALNPNGPAIYLYPFETIGIGALSAYVAEWQAAWPDTQAGQLLAGWLLVGVLPTIVLAGRRMPIADLLILVGLTLMAAYAVRFLLVSGPITAAIVAVRLGPVVSASAAGRRLGGAVQRLSARRTGAAALINGALLIGVLTLGVAAAVLRALPATQRIAIAEVQPVAEVAWLVDHDAGERVFNFYEWGGYLGLHRPWLAVFIDGRADVYGEEPIDRYVATISLSSDPQRTFDEYAIDHVLFPVDSPLAGWLDASAGWERVHSGPLGAIWLRR